MASQCPSGGLNEAFVAMKNFRIKLITDFDSDLWGMMGKMVEDRRRHLKIHDEMIEGWGVWAGLKTIKKNKTLSLN